MKLVIRDEWVSHMTKALCLKHPGKSKDKIREQVEKIFDKKFVDTKCQIYDNYNEDIYDVTLAGTLDWIKDKNPLICESGVFFHQKSECRSLQTEIIKECMLDMRDIHKGEKFKAMEAGDSITAGIKDLQQNNDKKAANSGYGAEGEKSSFLFNLHSAMSVTAAGRGQLSTAMQSMENYFGDSVKFFDENDFLTFVMNIVSEKTDWKFNTFDYIEIIPSKKEFAERFRTKFRFVRKAPIQTIENVYESLNEEMRVRVFYKCNMRAFLLQPKITKLIEKLAETKVEFIDPNKIVGDIAEPLAKLQELCIEFVNYKFSVYKYEDRSKSLPRSVIIVSDTDSVFVNCDPLFNFITDTVLAGNKSIHEDETYDMRMTNVIVCLADCGIKATLANYLQTVNVAEADRKFVLMKNEFHYSTIVTTFAMKSYFGLQIRQEKVILDPPKLDVKGVNFFKSTSSKHTTDFIYDEILMGEILQPKDGKIKVRRILSKIHQYQEEMADRIRSGDMGYMKESIRVKSPDGYSRPMSIGQYKAVYVWNSVCEQHDLIELPGTVTIVKVKIRKREDIVPLADFPGMFEKFDKLFEDPNLLKERVNSKGETVYDFTGIKSIALPGTYDKVPDWLLSIIDVETLIQDNMKLFVQLQRPLGLSPGRSSHNGETMKYYTNIIRI